MNDGMDVTGTSSVALGKEELGRDLVNAAYLRGDFVLTSGLRSSYYFDKYLFETKPGILRRVAGLIATMVPPEADRLGGPELGAVALTTAVSLETGLPFVILKKHAKEYGTSKSIEGELYRRERVVVIEDILTTGGEAIRAANTVKRAGAEVSIILAVIDREQGAQENLTAAGFKSKALFTRTELGL
jgi:orotate phosphoribosyltransferase